MLSRIAEHTRSVKVVSLRLHVWVLLFCACDDYNVPRDTSGSFDTCCGDQGTCVARALVDEAQLFSLDRNTCQSRDLVCIPSELLKGSRTLHACKVAQTGAEGRCLPDCLPDVAAQKGLRRDNCGPKQLCAPCYDPITGLATDACKLGADLGPKQPAVLFDACCGELGRCLPSELIEAADRDQLSSDTCQAGQLCAPSKLASSKAWKPQACTDPVTTAEGRCLPACLPGVAERKHKLSRSTCPIEHLCAPCVDPVTAQSTGACSLGADTGPKEPAHVFAMCCGELGRCVPQALVDAADREQLAADSCDESSDLCVPEPLAKSDQAQLVQCEVAATGGEGRCLPACLPALMQRAQHLERTSPCVQGEVCAPCYDPIDARSTGACELGGDTGPSRSPALFASCCGELGRCVPERFVSDAERSQLQRDSCSEERSLCAPEPLLREPEHVFERCSVAGTRAEGRCLPGCLPHVAARAAQLRQSSCSSGHLCAPCYDPIDGASTGACSLGGDPGPTQSSVLFSDCCQALGKCVPSSLIATAERARLASDSCRSGELCVPSVLASEPEYVFASCTESSLSAEGRCLPACLPDVAARAAQLRQDGCANGELCAACYEPIAGAESGACELGGDPGPQKPALTYPHCCNDAGRCIARERVPEAQRSRLNGDGCSSAGAPLCVPLTLAQHPDAPPASCHDTATGAEGRCLMRCLPGVQARASQLRQGSCNTDELCAPCYDPISGESTGACNSTGDDAPREPPVVFGECCAGDGRCVPSTLVSTTGDIQILSPQECTQQGWVCAPRVMLEGAQSRLPVCSSTLGPSVCLNQCFVPSGLSELFPASSCSEADSCVPCYVATGLCP